MPNKEDKFNLYQILKKTIQEEKPVVLTTVLVNQSDKAVKPGAKMLVFPDGVMQGNLGNPELNTRVVKNALELLSKERAKTLAYEFSPAQKIEVYIEPLLPPPPLIIIGGDADSIPIVRLSKQLGFKVILVDHRPNFANPQKYPEANQTVVADPEDFSQRLQIDEKSFILIKTHNYLKDKKILKTVLKSKARYIGQLGPKARTEDLLKDLSREGVSFTAEALAKLYAPVGLDIGAESPEQIAMSIVAELLAAKNGREGGFLKNQTQAIHPRD
ncbi:MAG: XdhC family protein [bacterium]